VENKLLQSNKVLNYPCINWCISLRRKSYDIIIGYWTLSVTHVRWNAEADSKSKVGNHRHHSIVALPTYLWLYFVNLHIIQFLAHLSWKLKWAFLIGCCPASVCKLSHFRLLLQNHQTNFNQTWHKSCLVEWDSNLIKGRG
jgi:hypothetical protein